MRGSSLNNLEHLGISQEVSVLQVPNTPFLSYLLGAGKVEATKSTKIKWREYGINDDDSSTQLEDEGYAGAGSDRTWFNDYTEILRESTSASGTLDAIDVDGIGNELNSQVALHAAEVKVDLDHKLIVGVRVDRSGSKGRQINGILSLISSTNKVGTAAAGTATRKDTDVLFKTMLQKGHMGERLCLVAPDMQELMINQLDEKSTKIVQFDDRLTFGLQLGNVISNYGSGIALIEPNLPNGAIAAIDTNYVKLRPLREWYAEELAKTTNSRRAGLVGRYSIEYKASNSGAILNLKA